MDPHAMLDAAIADALRAAEAGPVTRDASGRRLLTVRGMIPFRTPITSATRSARDAVPAAVAAVVDALAAENRDMESEADPEGGPPSEPEMADPAGVLPCIEGIASSTSVDYYGTDMSRACLEAMAEQFRAGVPLTDTHGSFFEAADWTHVIGMSVDAKVEDADVETPFDKGEKGAVLRTTDMLYDVPVARELVARVDAGQPIGQSIGGWFTDLTVVMGEDADEYDDPERIIVNSVRLDHKAITRMPANPDSKGIGVLRTAIGSELQRRAKHAAQAAEIAALEARDMMQEHVPQPVPVAAPAVSETPEPMQTRAARVDEVPAPCHDGAVTADAHRGAAPGQPHDEAPTEPAMDKLDEILNAVRSQGDRLAALEARSAAPVAPAAAPAVTPLAVDPALEARAVAAEARAKAAEAALTRAMSEPVRTGLAYIPDGGNRAKTALDALVVETRSAGCPTLAAAAEEVRHVLQLSTREFLAEAKRAQNVADADRALHTLLRAAEHDGVITNPFESSWQ